MSNIPSTPADGNVRTDILTAIADISAPTVTELNAGENISCYITAGGFVFSPEQAAISDDRECDTFTAEQPGRTTVSGATITVIDNTGTSLSSTDNDAVDALVPGSTIYISRRYGLAYDAAYVATTQKTDVIKAIVGKKQRVAIEANSVLRSTYPLFIQDFEQDVTVAAGA
jgi:hypothetical protein